GPLPISQGFRFGAGNQVGRPRTVRARSHIELRRGVRAQPRFAHVAHDSYDLRPAGSIHTLTHDLADQVVAAWREQAGEALIYDRHGGGAGGIVAPVEIPALP